MPPTLKDESNLLPSPPAPKADMKQRNRMLLALAVLLVAVIIVLIKDRGLWFAASAEVERASQTESVAPPGPAPSLPAPATPAAAVTATPAKKKSAAKVERGGGNDGAPMVTATERAVLPPLDVEVVAGNQ